MWNDLPPWAEALAAALLVLGGVFALLGALGMLRLPDFYMRLHAPTKAATLGVGGALLASIVLQAARGEFGWRELLITLFVFITAPVSANLLAQAALHLGVGSTAPVPGQPGREAAEEPPPTRQGPGASG